MVVNVNEKNLCLVTGSFLIFAPQGINKNDRNSR